MNCPLCPGTHWNTLGTRKKKDFIRIHSFIGLVGFIYLFVKSCLCIYLIIHSLFKLYLFIIKFTISVWFYFTKYIQTSSLI